MIQLQVLLAVVVVVLLLLPPSPPPLQQQQQPIPFPFVASAAAAAATANEDTEQVLVESSTTLTSVSVAAAVEEDDRSCSSNHSLPSSSSFCDNHSSQVVETEEPTTTTRIPVVNKVIGGGGNGSNSSSSSGTEFESLRRQFLDDGYVVVRQFFTTGTHHQHSLTKTTESSSLSLPLLLSSWRTYSKEYFDWLFTTLYDKKLTPFNVHGRKLKKEKGKEKKVTNKISSSENTPPASSKYEYALPVGTSSGFKEIVHRHPGRYEIRVLPTDWYSTSATKSRSDNHRNREDDDLVKPEPEQETKPPPKVPPLQPIIDQVTPLVSAILMKGNNIHHRPSSTNGDSGNSMSTAELKVEQEQEYFLNLQYSLIVAMPGSTAQRWHTDSGHLSLTEQLPPHCLNVFIPLVDVTKYKGMTEIVPKSHQLSRQQKQQKQQQQHQKKKQSRDNQSQGEQRTAETTGGGGGYRVEITDDNKPVANTLDAGDILLFDYRVWHRGLENKTNKPRPVLVLTFSIPTWEDTVNWPSRSIFDISSSSNSICDDEESVQELEQRHHSQR